MGQPLTNPLDDDSDGKLEKFKQTMEAKPFTDDEDASEDEDDGFTFFKRKE